MTILRTGAASLLSIAAALAMPLAFAQQAPTADSDSASTGDVGGQSQPPAQTGPAATGGAGEEPRQLTWADVDIDGSGAISKEESSQLPSLAQVFADADADADGQLTPDEYKAYVATVGGPADAGGGD